MLTVLTTKDGRLVACSMDRGSAMACFVSGLVASLPGAALLWVPADAAIELMVLCWVWIAVASVGFAQVWSVLMSVRMARAWSVPIRGSIGSSWAAAAVRESLYLHPMVLVWSALSALSSGVVLPAPQWTALISLTASALMLSQCVWIVQRGGRDIVLDPRPGGGVRVTMYGQGRQDV